MSKSTKATKATVAPSVTVESLVADYSAVKGGDRTKMRHEWSEAMRNAMRDGNIELAEVYLSATDAADDMKAAKSTAREIDWTALVEMRIATLRHAADLLESGSVIPTGAGEIDHEALATVEWSNVPTDHDAATKMASARVGGRVEVTPWIEATVDGFDSGSRLSVAEMIRANPTDAPGNGALSAALNAMLAGKRDLPTGVGSIAAADSDGPLGVVVA